MKVTKLLTIVALTALVVVVFSTADPMDAEASYSVPGEPQEKRPRHVSYYVRLDGSLQIRTYRNEENPGDDIYDDTGEYTGYTSGYYDDGQGDAEHWMYIENPDGSGFFDRVFCGVCHTNTSTKELRKSYNRASYDNHSRRYFPGLEYRLQEGGKLHTSGKSHFAMERGQLVYYNNELTKILTAPYGSRILKNKSGKPILVQFKGRPTILPPTPKK